MSKSASRNNSVSTQDENIDSAWYVESRSFCWSWGICEATSQLAPSSLSSVPALWDNCTEKNCQRANYRVSEWAVWVQSRLTNPSSSHPWTLHLDLMLLSAKGHRSLMWSGRSRTWGSRAWACRLVWSRKRWSTHWWPAARWPGWGLPV